MKFLKNKLAVTIIVLSVAFLIAISYSATRKYGTLMESGVGRSFNSVQGFFYNVGINIKGAFSTFFNFNSIQNENEELKKSVANYETKAVGYDNLLQENENLRKMLDFKAKRGEYDYVGADVVGRGSGGWTDGFILNKGSKDGLLPGLIAITPEGLVGQITHVYDSWSEIDTVGNENFTVSFYVTSVSSDIPKLSDAERKEKPIGALSGYKNYGDSDIYAKGIYLPLDAKIEKGDTVFTSGVSSEYPKDIRIGTVLSIEADKGKAMTSILVKPFVNLKSLEYVFIVIPKNGSIANGKVQY
ncbi:MAG: rod shape-determining protein MreC [Clostridiaceae bacterium]